MIMKTDKTDKKMYYRLSDNCDVSNVVLTLEDCMNWIETEMQNSSEYDDFQMEFTITPVWMTDEEIEALPEYE